MIAVGELESRGKVNEADPRVKRTRKLLKDAFLELLSEKSFDSISVQDIAERAMVNRATFYLHFEDKYRLYDHMTRDMFRRTVEKKLPPAATFSRTNLRLLVLASLEAFEKLHGGPAGGCPRHSPAVKPLVLAAVQDSLHEFIHGWLEQLPADSGRPPEAMETAATTVSWALFGVGMRWGQGDSALSAEQMANQVLGLLTGGLATMVPSGILE